MPKIGRRKRKKLSSSSSSESPATAQDQEDEILVSQTFATIMASEEGDNGSPSLADVWKVLTEIKTNTEKLVLEVNSLKVNYNELQDNLASAKAQVDILVEENKFLTSKVKSLEDDCRIKRFPHSNNKERTVFIHHPPNVPTIWRLLNQKKTRKERTRSRPRHYHMIKLLGA